MRLCFVLILFLFANCEKIADSLFSDHDDVSMGLSMDKEIRENRRQFKILKNEEIRSYIQNIVKQILRSPQIKRKKLYPYKITILEDDKVVNAFCTPGGFIYVYTGLLKFLENEASLAAVLSHEIAHAEKRHARQRMLSSTGIQLVVMLVVSYFGGSGFADISGRLAGNLAILTNSRADEMEADEMGFLYMRTTPYYQGAMTYFFEKIEGQKKHSGKLGASVERLLSTHPLPKDRLMRNEKRIAVAKVPPPTPGNLFSDRYIKEVRKLK